MNNQNNRIEKISCKGGGGGKDEEDDAPLPGFRFHPTDEELVGFYLRRKVEKKPMSIEQIIKQIDIYKYDPWDLPKASNVGDKEWYFFCKRGRKYRNSIRPNRVTGSGFWKATGIDRPIYSTGGQGHDCIGLKKSLVYYRGSAGKGTKTDWMMHEFRLPPDDYEKNNKYIDAKTTPQEAEVWTLCRILKRNVSYRKCIPDWRELSAAKRNTNAPVVIDASSETCSVVSDNNSHHKPQAGYNISFRAPINNIQQANENKPVYFPNHINETNSQFQLIGGHHHHQLSPNISLEAPLSGATTAISSYNSGFSCPDMKELFRHRDSWDDLRSIVEFAADPLFM